MSFRQTPNLRNLLIHANVRHGDINTSDEPPGCFKCQSKRCIACSKYIKVGNKFESIVIKETFPITSSSYLQKLLAHLFDYL